MPSVQSKPSKSISSLFCASPIPFFLPNYGTDSCSKHRTHSTCSVSPPSTFLDQPTIIIEVPHDFNRQPWAPPGCRTVIHEPADTRTSWGPRITEAWYIGPAANHYLSYEFNVPETWGYHIFASAQFFPTYCKIPTETPIEEAACTTTELIIELHQHRHTDNSLNLSWQQHAIIIINDIYQLSNKQSPRVEENTGQPPRVEPTLPSNPTASWVIKTVPHKHNRTTQNNTPGLASLPQPTRRSPRLNPTPPAMPTVAPTTSPMLQLPVPTTTSAHLHPIKIPITNPILASVMTTVLSYP
ncbi:hypothetical protein ACHAW6_015777 [Cyclotella cf. meneghiniana]